MGGTDARSAVSPGAPVHAQPRAGKDEHRMRVVAAANAGGDPDGMSPGIGAPRVVSEATGGLQARPEGPLDGQGQALPYDPSRRFPCRWFHVGKLNSVELTGKPQPQVPTMPGTSLVSSRGDS